MSKPSFIASPPVVALLSWLLPGAGYFAIGAKKRGLTIGITILTLFFLGILIGGIRVIDPPGYDDLGERAFTEIRREEVNEDGRRMVRYRQYKVREGSKPDEDVVSGSRQWSLTNHPLATIGEKPWYVGQILVGPVNLICTKLALNVAGPASEGSEVSRVARSHARVSEIGTLYTAVAGMLNLLALIDATHRAGRAGGSVE